MNTNKITQRSSVTQSYFTDIYSIPQLEDSEMEKLVDKILERDPDTLNLLVVSNLRFAISEAKRYQGLGLHLDDLISEANIGLIKAAEKYDPTTGFRFISYAVWWIRQGITSALSNYGKTVRFPQNVYTAVSKIKKAYSLLEQDLERPPTENEIAEFLCFTNGQMRNVRHANLFKMELDAPMRSKDGGDNSSYLEITPNTQAERPDSVFEDLGIKIELNRLLSILPPRERDILESCYGVDKDDVMTLEEIASRKGLTRERVRQLRNKALRKVRERGGKEVFTLDYLKS